VRLLAVLIAVTASQLLGERFGSGDGERQTLLTQQIAFEPLPASVLFVLAFDVWFVVMIALL
jgi:hypothetical protein